MEVVATPSKRKVIDLKGNTFRTLSVMAAKRGTNLKKFIETLLDNAAEKYDDAALYEYLCETRPEGKVMLDAQEKTEFENWLGLNVK